MPQCGVKDAHRWRIWLGMAGAGGGIAELCWQFRPHAALVWGLGAGVDRDRAADPGLFQMLQFAPPTETIKLSADKKSVVMGSLNDTWEWTYTPTVK